MKNQAKNLIRHMRSWCHKTIKSALTSSVRRIDWMLKCVQRNTMDASVISNWNWCEVEFGLKFGCVCGFCFVFEKQYLNGTSKYAIFNLVADFYWMKNKKLTKKIRKIARTIISLIVPSVYEKCLLLALCISGNSWVQSLPF